jgi:hypothetical protein
MGRRVRRIQAFAGSCCGDDWSCLLCSGVSCWHHDPSPGELSQICDQCWNPIDFPKEDLTDD